ncbi:hypothetical protein RJT34_18064 [Clitoria ternatea]|uniref:Uncharacterized protein n=1 Tax=Clitoria ternatea TaxID=43366 RepID=A0AAN9PF26_CLITE
MSLLKCLRELCSITGEVWLYVPKTNPHLLLSQRREQNLKSYISSTLQFLPVEFLNYKFVNTSGENFLLNQLQYIQID